LVVRTQEESIEHERAACTDGLRRPSVQRVGSRTLTKIYLFETETLEKTGNRGTRVAIGGLQDISLHRGFLKLALGFLTNFTFQIRIGRGEQAGVAGIDARLRVVEASDENLSLGKAKRDGLTLNDDVAGLQLAKVDAPDDFAMYDEKETIAHQEFRQVRAVVFTGNDFVHGKADGLEALKLLDLADHGGLVNVDQSAATISAQKRKQTGAGSKPDDEADSEKSQEKAKQKCFYPRGGWAVYTLRVVSGIHGGWTRNNRVKKK
jgi:hypothetical protein